MKHEDLTEKIGFKTIEELYDLAFKDGLTNVYNRNMLREVRNDFDCKELFITIVNIDNLKTINDNNGHLFGNTVLVELATKLQEKSDMTFRLGGDEFLLINRSFEPIFLRDICGVSHGTVYKSPKKSLADAMREADSIMYSKKMLNKKILELEDKIKKDTYHLTAHKENFSKVWDGLNII